MYKEKCPQKSICLLRLSSLGDVTHMIPIINTLKEENHKTNITWIINKTEYELVKNIENINFVVIDKQNLFKSLKQLYKLRRSVTFDIFLHMQVSLRSNILSMIIKANRKIGYNKSLSKNLHSLLNYEEIECEGDVHVLDSFFCFLKKISINKRKLDWSVNIIKNNLQKKLLDSKYTVINPFTSSRRFNYREWDLENYKNIAEYLYNEYQVRTLVVGGPSAYEIEKSKTFNDIDYIHNYVAKTNLIELYRILKNCLIYIGPDSGTLHIASMLDKPVIGLYVTSNPNRTGPYHNRQYTINKYPDALRLFEQKSESDVKWGYRIRNKKAMSLIKIEDVINMIKKIMVKY